MPATRPTQSALPLQAETAPCDLSIIIVSWNVWELLRGCLVSIERATLPGAHPQLRTLIRPQDALPPVGLRSIPSARPQPARPARRRWSRQPSPQPQPPPPPAEPPESGSPSVEVIVVDNGSSDGTPARLAAHFGWVRVLANTENAGFTRANNQAFARSNGRFVYFLNPDTELLFDRVHGSSLWLLYEALVKNQNVAVAGPQLRYANNEKQPSARRFPEPLTGFFESTWLGRALPLNPWSRRLHMSDWPVSWGYDVDWVVGAAMLCRRSALLQVMEQAEDGGPWPWPGPFDERFFMYSEETDLCMRLKPAGLRVIYVPQAWVIHFEGRSSEQAVAARHINFNRSKVLFWRKWFGPRWSEALRRYLLLEFRLQMALEAAKWLVGHKRELRRRRIAAYRDILATRLREE